MESERSFDKAYDAILEWIFPHYTADLVRKLSLEEKIERAESLNMTDQNMIDILKAMHKSDYKVRAIKPQNIMKDINHKISKIYIDDLIKNKDKSFDDFKQSVFGTYCDNNYFNELIYSGNTITIIIKSVYYRQFGSKDGEYTLSSKNGFSNGRILHAFAKLLSYQTIRTCDAFNDNYYLNGLELNNEGKYVVDFGSVYI